MDRLSADRFQPAISDVATQLGQLVYPGFLTGLGAERLPHVVRYVAAARRRLERLPEDPQRDYREMQAIHDLESVHDRLVDDHGFTTDLLDITWMLQELRVSVFAQAIGVHGTVSHKRVRQALAQVERTA
jgi:ATP-dependent helicase HrpA